MDIESLWPWPLTKGHQFQYGSSQWGKQPFSKNRVQIGASVRLEFCSEAEPDTHTHTHTHAQTNCSGNITPPLFCGGVIICMQAIKVLFSNFESVDKCKIRVYSKVLKMYVSSYVSLCSPQFLPYRRIWCKLSSEICSTIVVYQFIKVEIKW